MSTPAVTPLLPAQSLPERLRAGDSYAWAVQTSLSAGTFVFYVLSGVVANQPLRYLIALPTGTPPAGGVAVDATGLASFTLPSPTTAKYQPGRYTWVAFSLDALGNRDQIAEGALTIDPDPAGLVVTDTRTQNERMLAAIRTLLQNKVLDDAQSYKIGTRELVKIDPIVLLRYEAIYEARVRNERIRNGEYVPTKTRGILFGGRW